MKRDVKGKKYRHVPDPHKRGSIFISKKVYNRKKARASKRSEPFELCA